MKCLGQYLATEKGPPKYELLLLLTLWYDC